MILTDRLLRNLQNRNIEPILVLEIDGVPFLIGSDTIKKYARYGDDGLTYGQAGLVYGGLVDIPNQKTLISLEGTTTTIKQNLNPDKARATGVSQMTINLIDRNLEGTKLLAGAYGEILFKKVKVWLSFGISAWKQDFLIVFRGVIESVSAEQGRVKLNLNSPQQKQRQLLAPKVETRLDGAIDNVQTSVTLESIDNLIFVPDHPAYSPKDETLKTYVKIDDEFIRYTGFSGNTLTGCTRGQFFSTPVAHADQADVTSFYELDGLNMDIALKIMLSDKDQSYYIENLPSSYVNWNGTSVEPNTFFFPDIDLTRERNVEIGDFVVTSGFLNAGNNLSFTRILDVVVNSSGSYILVDATLTTEPAALGSVSFLSQYNTFGGFGLGLDTDEVDIDRHIQLRNSFLTDFQLRFFIKEEIEDAREWIEKELYLVSSCYSLPTDREGLSRLSVGIHKPPIPSNGIVKLDETSVLKPENISVKRSINKYHYNAVLFLYEDSPEEDTLRNRTLTVVGTQSIPTGNKALVIESKGLKLQRDAQLISTASGERLLERYKDAAEFLENVDISFSKGVQITVGDIVIFDPTNLNMISNASQDRNKEPLLMEVVNKSVDIKTGSVKVDLIDTSFNINARFGLFSPCSLIKSVISPTQFVITYVNEPSIYGAAEYRKWNRLKEPAVAIRNADYTEYHQTRILNVTANTILIETAPSFTLTAGHVMEFAPYSDPNTTLEQKLIYAYWTDGANPFPDSEPAYVFI